MKIDLEKAKKEFIEYTNKYDIKNENISRKIGHSIRVMNISKKIATKIQLTQEEIEVAILIGLLHDIARFEQYTQFQTFKDLDSFDHGDYALEILEKDIRKYIQIDKYDEIIKKSIKNHNKYEIENGLTPKEELFSKIIRDADKIDILYESQEMFWNGLENQINESKVSKKIEEQFKNYKQIKREKNNNNKKSVNNVISVISFIFDINYKSSFEILKENNYINKIIDRFNFKHEETKNKMEEIRKISNEYIENKIKE